MFSVCYTLESLARGEVRDLEVKHGFWIDLTDPWLGGSPDGVIETKNEGVGLLEIKCPYTGKDMTVPEMV